MQRISTTTIEIPYKSEIYVLMTLLQILLVMKTGMFIYNEANQNDQKISSYATFMFSSLSSILYVICAVVSLVSRLLILTDFRYIFSALFGTIVIGLLGRERFSIVLIALDLFILCTDFCTQKSSTLRDYEYNFSSERKQDVPDGPSFKGTQKEYEIFMMKKILKSNFEMNKKIDDMRLLFEAQIARLPGDNQLEEEILEINPYQY